MLSSDTFNRRSDQDSVEFWSAGDTFGFRLYRRDLEKVVNHCRKAHPKETGGIIIGKYTRALDCAIITKLTEAPKDSRSGKTWFSRGVSGLNKILNAAWEGKEFYLGEWHFHPNGEPEPSSTDIQQLEKFSRSNTVNCAEPVLMIVGGDPAFSWKLRLFVFPRNRNPVELLFLGGRSC